MRNEPDAERLGQAEDRIERLEKTLRAIRDALSGDDCPATGDAATVRDCIADAIDDPDGRHG